MASLKNGNSSNQMTGERRPRKFFPKFPERVTNGSHFYGWVSHVEDPFHFYVRLETGETQKLRYLLAELEEESPLAETIYKPFQGLACAAKLNGHWGRALLEKYQPGSDNVEVFFVDSGHRKVVKVLDLKSLDDSFMSLPVQAVLCHLSMIITNVKNPNTPWSDESCTFFKELVEECFVNIFTVGNFYGGVGCLHPNQESKLFVTMYIGDEKKTVNTILSRAGHGQGTNLHEHAWHETKRISLKSLVNSGNGCKTKSSNTLMSDGKQLDLRQDVGAQPFDSSTSSLQLQKQQHSLIFKEEDPKCSTGMPPISIDVSVCHVIDPGKFYVRHQSFETYNQYQALFNKTAPGLERPWDIKNGGFYLVFDEQSKRWFRAKCSKSTECTTVQSEKMFDFYLVDEGHNTRAPITAIRELNEELKSIRPMVWECSLAMDSPKNGWTKPMIDYFKNWIRREKYKLTVLSIQDSVRKVDLAQIPSSPNETVEKSSIKSLREYGIGKEGGSKAESSTSRPSSLEMVESSKAKYVTNLHKLKKGSCVRGKVIQVTDPDDFYIRIDDVDDRDFSTFTAQLQNEYNDLDDVDIGIPWKGFPYIVRYQGSWHRALVEDVVNSEHIFVFLVDSGLRMNITAADVRHIQEKYMNYPVQVVQCKLFGICPKNPSGLWPLEGKNFFKQMVTGVRLDIYVERAILGGVGKTLEEESLLCVVLYVEGKDSSVNTRLTRTGHGISVRQHDLPSHNRPKASIVKKSTSDLTLPTDDIDLLISGLNEPEGNVSKAKGSASLEKLNIPIRPAPTSSPGLDIDDLINKVGVIRPPITREDDIDLLINGSGIRSSVINQSMPNIFAKEQPQENVNLKDGIDSNNSEGPSWKPIAVNVLTSLEKPIATKSIPDHSQMEESNGKAEMKENCLATQELSLKFPVYKSANSAEPNEEREVSMTNGKLSIALRPTRGFSAGDILAAEVALLECCYQAIGLDGSLKTEGKMPRESDYIVAVKFLMCPSTHNIFVRPIIYESKFEDMNIELQKAYRSSKVSKMAHVEVGNRCAAFVYGQWIRAVITDIDADLRCSITSIDCGQPHVIPYDQIYSLISPFDSIPKLALKCSLLGVKLDNGSPNDEITAKITNTLLQAYDVYIFCSHRPKAIPSLLEVNIIYRHETEIGVVLTNLKDWLVG